MKKFILVSLMFAGIVSCNNGNTEDASNDGTPLTNPSSIDTTKHPEGMVNSNVTSTDTAAINVSNSYKKLDSVKNK